MPKKITRREPVYCECGHTQDTHNEMMLSVDGMMKPVYTGCMHVNCDCNKFVKAKIQPKKDQK